SEKICVQPGRSPTGIDCCDDGTGGAVVGGVVVVGGWVVGGVVVVGGWVVGGVVVVGGWVVGGGVVVGGVVVGGSVVVGGGVVSATVRYATVPCPVWWSMRFSLHTVAGSSTIERGPTHVPVLEGETR